jgi:hypothetical protein
MGKQGQYRGNNVLNSTGEKTEQPLMTDDCHLDKQVSGPTIFMNCWHRHGRDTNPAHWLMKMHKLFEMGEVSRPWNGSQGHPALPTFETMALHQCPSLKSMLAEEDAWPWGLHVFKAATRKWARRGLWNSLASMAIIELADNDPGWVCFEDLFFEVSYGMWFPSPHFQREWRISLLEGLHLDEVNDDVSSLRKRCRQRSLNITIFQRSSGSLRSFLNIQEVLHLLQSYTSEPVSVVTVNSSTTVGEQALLFKSFDLLVTPPTTLKCTPPFYK